jgi:hypothetical protein
MNNRRSTSATADVDEIGIKTEQDHPLTEAGAEAGETAGHLAERAAEVGFQQADRAREQTADGLNQLADSVRRVSSDMESEQPAMANLTSTAAEQTERIASYLRETDARQLVHTVEDVARRQPLLFIGGAFLLGLAASRFVKAAGGGQSGSTRRGGHRYAGMYGPSGGYGAGTYGADAGYAPTGPGDRRAGDIDAVGGATDEGLRP